MFGNRPQTRLRITSKAKGAQYALVERARQLGWADVEVIDDDLGRSGSGRLTARFREASRRNL
jgi:hypothetical protein